MLWRTLLGVFTLACLGSDISADWPRHTIDKSSRGADGVRLADINADGRWDLVTGWEEGGQIRICLQPESAKVRQEWSSWAVGNVKSPEDAVFCDLDGDGNLDVVSSCEGRTRTMFVHWNPGPAHLQDSARWITQPIPDSMAAQSWMFCLPMQIDGQHGVDLVTGSKGPAAAIGWWQSPENPRDLTAWKYHSLRPAGWIMTLAAHDMDADGDLDVLFSDRKGSRRGIGWLENPSAQKSLAGAKWNEHMLGGLQQEVMFLATGDLDHDERLDVVCAVRGAPLIWLKPTAGIHDQWTAKAIPLPAGCGTGKGVALADIDQDGLTDVVFSCENAANKHGLMGLMQIPPERTGGPPRWRPQPISGDKEGIKFDLIQLRDVDRDGDLDVLTCEERDNLGVIWYENPAQSP